MRGASLAAVLLVVLALAVVTASAADKVEPFVPDNFPLNVAPVDWPGNPGTRYEMPELVKKYKTEDIILKTCVPRWTKAQWEKDDMGAFVVGDRVEFTTVVGDKASRYFGSVKDHRDGGVFRCTLFWMDETGKKVLTEDKTSVRYACATCDGRFNMYFYIPSTARTGRHRLNLTYVQDKLKLNLQKDLYFTVTNDGSWDNSSGLDALRAKYPSVAILQRGRTCKPLGIDSYAGVADLRMMSPNAVPDRREDNVNSGAEEVLYIGQYSMDNRTLISFDVSKVPAKAVLEEAWLQLYVASFAGRGQGTLAVRAYEVLKPWGEGRGNGNAYKDQVLPGEATWQCSESPAKWDKPGCDEPGKDRSADPVGESQPVKQTKVWAVVKLDKDMVKRWIADPKSNHGLLLTDPKGNRAALHSSEYEDPAMRPRLVLAFSSGMPDIKAASCTTETCGPATAPAGDK